MPRPHKFTFNLYRAIESGVPETETCVTWASSMTIFLDLSFNIKTATSQCSTAVRTVVRATQQVNGKWPFSGCQNSVTPEPID